MDFSIYKCTQSNGKEVSVQANSQLQSLMSQDNLESSALIHQILDANYNFFADNLEVTIQAMDFLAESIPKSPTNVQYYLFTNFDYLPKIFQIYNAKIKQNELKSMLQMIYMILTSKKVILQVNINPTLKFCIDIMNELIHNCTNNEVMDNISLCLDCIIELADEDNYSKLNESFFEQIIPICFSTDKIKINCSRLVEKMSNFVPKIHDFKYFFDFFKYMCYSINPDFAVHLYSSLRNIIKKYPESVKVPDCKSSNICSSPQFWIYNMILNSYRYNYNCQSIGFEICSFLKKDAICILEDQNIKMNILSALKKTQNDERINSAIHALTHFVKIDSENCAIQYFTIENSENMSPFLIKHVMESPFNVKVDAGYLLSFAIYQAPHFFAKEFIKSYQSKVFINPLASLEDAIVAILSFNIPDLQIQMINCLNAIYDQCKKWGLIDQLFERFSTQIIPILDDLQSNENEDVARLSNDLFALLTRNHSKSQ